MESKPLKLCSPFTTVFRFQCVPTLNNAEKTSCVLCFGENNFTTCYLHSYNYTCVLVKLCLSLSLSLSLCLCHFVFLYLFLFSLDNTAKCLLCGLWIRRVKAIRSANDSLGCSYRNKMAEAINPSAWSDGHCSS